MADPDEPGVVRGVMLSYAADLMTAMTVALICARLLAPSPDLIGGNPVMPDDLLAAIGRFTPFGLWEAYQDTLLDALRNFSHAAATGPMSSLLLGLRTILLFLAAAPETLLNVYWQSVGDESWFCLADAALTGGAFAILLSGGRPSPARLLLAAILAPALASIVFWLMQQTVLDAMSGLAWFAHMAPWCLPCPVICTLWWVCFPRATHGATATLVLFVQQHWTAARTRRPVVRPSPVGNRPH